MIATWPSLAKVGLRRNTKGGNVKGRVVCIHRTPWNTHARMNRNEISCQSRSRVAGGPPSLTGSTGPRIYLDRMFLRRSDWVSSAPTTQGTRIGISSSSLLIVLRPLLGYVGRDDGEKGPTLQDSARRPLRNLISSRHMLDSTGIDY